MEKKKGLTASALQYIAMATMLTDHAGAFIIYGLLMADPKSPGLNALYFLMRMVGRMAFPIFAFLLIEGNAHTSDPKKYAARLLISAVISEIPFDLATNGTIIYAGYQNVIWTLLFCFIMLRCFERIKRQRHLRLIKYTACFLTVFICACAFKSDYHIEGPVLIAALWFLRSSRILQCTAEAVIAFCTATQPFIGGMLSAIPMYFYNGENGKRHRYLGYVFYPAHLLLLYFANRLMFLTILS